MILQKDKTRSSNQLHAETHSAEPIRETIIRTKNRIKYLQKQIDAIEKQISELIKKDTFISEKIKKITSIPGVGVITTATILAETNGFCSIKNQKQLTSYAGYDIVLKESGKWKGKSKISKKETAILGVHYICLHYLQYNIQKQIKVHILNCMRGKTMD